MNKDNKKQGQEEVKALASLPEEDIDTSDIPEVSDWSGAERGRFYRAGEAGGSQAPT